MSNVTKPVMLDDTGKSVAQALGSVATAINNMDKVQWGQVKGTLSNQIDLKNNLDSLQGQIDSFTALTPGSTTGDAELTNIRVDSSGNTYNTAGDAVRAIDSQVKALKTGFDGVVYSSPAAMVRGNDGELDEQISILPFRGTQKINKGINGITFLLVTVTGDNTITNTELQHADTDIKVSCPADYKYIVAYYSAAEWTTANHIYNTSWITGEHIIPAGSYYAVQFRKLDNSAFTNGEADKILLSFQSIANYDAYEYINSISAIIPFRKSQRINKYVNGVTFLLADASGNNIITNDTIQYAQHNVKLNAKTGYEFIVHFYKSAEWTTANHLYATSWKSEFTIPAGSYYVVQMRKTDSSAFNEREGAKTNIEFNDTPHNDNTLYHIIVTGQSLAVGAEGNPALTTTTPYEYIGKSYQFNGGSRPVDGMENDTGVEEINILDQCLANFESLREQTHVLTLGEGEDQRHAYQGETISSAMGYWFSKLTGKKCLVSNHGFGGKSYNQLKKGTIAYNNSIRAVYHAKELCDRIGWKYVVYAIAVVHGEADSYPGQTAETYKAYLREWQQNYDADIKAITGQVETVQLFSGQTASAGVYELEESVVANGVFLAASAYSDIHVVAPQYAWPILYWSAHMKNTGYRALGEYFGVVIGRAFNRWDDTVLYPIKTELSGSKITITYNSIPAFGSLMVDTSNVAAVSDGHLGFEMIGDDNVSITDVQIVDNKIQISLSGTPASGAKISYAYKVLADEMGHIGYTDGPRGNIRSTWGFDSMFTEHILASWGIIFCIPMNWTIGS